MPTTSKAPAALAARLWYSLTDNVVCCAALGLPPHNILAARIAGLPEPALYADSWSGWITDLETLYNPRRVVNLSIEPALLNWRGDQPYAPRYEIYYSDDG